jgi:hypothetical protein
MLAAGAAFVLGAGAAQAVPVGDIVTVVEIDLAGPRAATGPNTPQSSIGGRTWIEFDIPDFDHNLRLTATARDTGGTPRGAGVECWTGHGCGIYTHDDSNHRVDDSDRTEFLTFTIPGDPSFAFKLVGVEFSYVESGDDAQIWVDDSLPGSNGSAAVRLDNIHNDSDYTDNPDTVCPSGGTSTCRVALVEGMEAYYAANSGDFSAPFDRFLTGVTLDDLFGTSFTFGGVFGENDNDWKISAVFWEVSRASEEVPEPAMLALFGLMLGGLHAVRRRRA